LHVTGDLQDNFNKANILRRPVLGTVTKTQQHATDDMEKRRAGFHSDIESLVPILRKRRKQCIENRSLLKETVQDLKDAGYFRVLQPAKYGGLELHPQDFCKAVTTIATGCMSTAWVCGVIGVHPFQLALFDERAQKEVWDKDIDCLVSSSYAPMAKVEPAKDGFKFSGRWGWSSGCDHCEWALLGGIVPNEGYRTFLIPRSDYEIDDTWFAMGLQGTGSKDVVIKDAFVPDYRTHRQMDGFTGENPAGSNMYDAPIYRIPWGQIFVRAVATAPIGGLRRALDLFIEGVQGGKSSTDTAKQMGDPAIQQIVAETDETIDRIESVMYRNFDKMMGYASEKQDIPMVLRIRSRYQASIAVEQCLLAINKLFSVAGGRSVFSGNEMQQILLDIRTSRAHIANNPTNFARNYGGFKMGAENADFFI
jgi:3-hydroxy-9,10-secoandrosta-1,3,5(10)-triene-9,17-dione monooxygenase